VHKPLELVEHASRDMVKELLSRGREERDAAAQMVEDVTEYFLKAVHGEMGLITHLLVCMRESLA
jgi:hypothetical protein